VDHGEPVTAKRVTAPAFESGAQPRPYRLWWLVILVLSLASWSLVFAVVSLLVALVH
jgi:hypothetical protein